MSEYRNRNSFGQWVADFRWAMNAMRAKRIRRGLMFSQRMEFDRALRPRIDRVTDDRQDVIAYPDALYHIKVDDVIRACEQALTVRDP